GSVRITASDDVDHINLRELPANTIAFINAQGGDDVVTLGSSALSLGGLLGRVTIIGGGGGDDRLILRDDGESAAHAYTLAAGSVVRDNGPAIGEGGFEFVDLFTGSGPDQFTVNATDIDTTTTLFAGGGDDRFSVNTAATLAGHVNILNIDGGAGSNKLSF